jgi:hypothetical protein
MYPSKANNERVNKMNFAYDVNDMNAAVAHAKKVKEQYARGNKEVAHALWNRDPNATQLDFEGFCVAMKKLYNL